MIAKHEAEMKELNDILYTMELRYRERETEAEHEFQGMMDELKNKVTAPLNVHTGLLCIGLLYRSIN